MLKSSKQLMHEVRRKKVLLSSHMKSKNKNAVKFIFFKQIDTDSDRLNAQAHLTV